MRNQKMTKQKNVKGITLIALVITIIVLLILAGVSIATLTSDRGIIRKANEAKEKTEIQAIKENVELIKIEEFMKNRNEELTKEQLLNLIKEKYKNSYNVANKIITADKKYQIVVNEDLTVEVSKYNEKIEPGELNLDLIYNEEVGCVEIYVSVGGIQSYEQYAKEILDNKLEEEKEKIIIDSCECETIEEVYDLLGVNNREEMFQEYNVKNIDELIIKYKMIEGYDAEANNQLVTITGGEDLNTEINLNEVSYITDYVTENGIYTYEAKYSDNEVEKQIEISKINQDINQIDIFTYDSDTGYITGIKDEYLKDAGRNVGFYGMVPNYKYLTYGAPILNIPNEIEGIEIKGIDYRAFMGIINIGKVNVPNTIEKIEDDAFYYCANLKKINIPNSVTSIGTQTFWWTNLQELFIPSSVTETGQLIGNNLRENKKLTIRCEATEKPTGWHSNWVGSSGMVIVKWGESL